MKTYKHKDSNSQSASNDIHHLIQESLTFQSGSFQVPILHLLHLRMDEFSRIKEINVFFYSKLDEWSGSLSVKLKLRADTNLAIKRDEIKKHHAVNSSRYWVHDMIPIVR